MVRDRAQNHKVWQARGQLVGPAVRVAGCRRFEGLYLHLPYSKCSFLPALLGLAEELSMYAATFLLSSASATPHQIMASVPLCHGNLYTSPCLPPCSAISWLKQLLALLC